MARDPFHNWSLQDSAELYNIPNWGKGYFGINEAGHLTVHPYKDPRQSLDLKDLVDQLRRRGIELPILLRFTDILRHRVQDIHEAFGRAIEEYEYQGSYCGVYPIKVNQQRQVVEELLDCGKPFHFGLECGSKPELLAVLALTHRSDIPVICNGFKDEDYIEMVAFAQKIGKRVIPVVEKYSELDLILRFSQELGIRPAIGIRVKLSSRGAGRWKLSSGARSKFGLSVTEVLHVVETLRGRDMLDCLELLHFHLGSQITNIHSIKNSISEVARIYVELARAGASLQFLDVGGGLGVDYDGSQTNFESSRNYSLQEYANDVVSRIKTVCEEAEVAQPTIVTEAGRATVAYHSVLVFDVLGVSLFVPDDLPAAIAEGSPQPIEDLFDLLGEVSKKNLIESYHDAVQSYDELMNLFRLGYLTLGERGLAEQLYLAVISKILRLVRTLDYVPEELDGLETQLSQTYFCNFSVFQSLPDSWAIQQLFPIVPVHRLHQEPTQRGVLADITCDSDGKVDRFIDLRDVKETLELHDPAGDEYVLAAFLVGAYQEILGDLHNLFGDTNSVHVSFGADDRVRLETVVKGDTVRQVLSYVQYSAGELIAQIRRDVEDALAEKRISLDEAARFVRFYENSMGAYTYLTSRSPADPTQTGSVCR